MEDNNEIKKVGDGVSNFFLVQVQYMPLFFTSISSKDSDYIVEIDELIIIIINETIYV